MYGKEHGSWNRRDLIGYRIAKVEMDQNDTITSHSILVEGFFNEKKQLYGGRPVDITQMDDGSILISDNWGMNIFRLTYNGNKNDGIKLKCTGGILSRLFNHIAGYRRRG